MIGRRRVRARVRVCGTLQGHCQATPVTVVTACTSPRSHYYTHCHTQYHGHTATHYPRHIYPTCTRLGHQYCTNTNTNANTNMHALTMRGWGTLQRAHLSTALPNLKAASVQQHHVTSQLQQALSAPVSASSAHSHNHTHTHDSLSERLRGKWKVMIGLEIHAQLITKSKLFSPSISAGSTAAAASMPNTCVSFFDIGLPGTLPQLNKGAVQQAVRAALALNCHVHEESIFERKHFFYQDQPLGYQITQQRNPVATDGRLNYTYTSLEDRTKPSHLLTNASIGEVRIERIQIEQDTGKSLHNAHKDHSLVDFNRAGTALVEIVFAPDLSEPEQAAGLLQTIQQTLRHINVCDGNLESGSMRCDVNISVAADSGNTLPAQEAQEAVRVGSNRVEIKNLNSMQRVVDAAYFEIHRQLDLLEQGVVNHRETRGFDVRSGTTYAMRAKEAAMDYRYLPCPDLPALRLPSEEVQRIQQELPELPTATLVRLRQSWGLDDKQAQLLISKPGGSRYYETVLQGLSALPVPAPVQQHVVNADHTAESTAIQVFHWIATELLGCLNTAGVTFTTSPLTPAHTVELLDMLDRKAITKPQSKLLLVHVFTSNMISSISDSGATSIANGGMGGGNEEYRGLSPKQIAEKLGMLGTGLSEERLEAICREAVNDPTNARRIQDIKGGNERAVNFFMGDIKRKTNGRANPAAVRSTIIRLAKELP